MKTRQGLRSTNAVTDLQTVGVSYTASLLRREESGKTKPIVQLWIIAAYCPYGTGTQVMSIAARAGAACRSPAIG
jgi:hypothetical protein